MTTHTENTIPQALVRMFPHGRAAQLAARVLAHADIIELALADYAEAHGHGSLDRTEASDAACVVQDFRHVLAQETADPKDSPARAPLTGTSGRSIVHTIAESILTMPEPKPGDGGWRQAAHNQIWRTGTRYTQMWEKDATYWAYTAAPQGEEL